MSLNPPYLPVPKRTNRDARNPPVPIDLVEWLRANFPPRCIRRGESEADARWYAAQVELAERLIRFGTPKEAPEGEYSIEV
jgi:hypothetical protein